MICIISSNELDEETNSLCEELLVRDNNFLRVNLDDFQNEPFYLCDDYFKIDSKVYYFKNFTVVYARRVLLEAINSIDLKGYSNEGLGLK